jgi:nucleotide-binding universal stress UspA family protein
MNMIKKILVPLDGSVLAEQALPSASTLARQSGATLVLLRAVPFFASTGEHLPLERAAVIGASTYLREWQERLSDEGLQVMIELVPGDPVRAILFAEAAYGIDVIGICTHGYTGVRHALLGSVAEAVLRQGTAPILLVRAGGQPTHHATDAFKRIVVPLDGTAFAETALTYITREHLLHDSQVTLLRIVEPVLPAIYPTISESAVQQLYDEAEHDTERLLGDAKAYLQTTGATYLASGQWQVQAQLGYTDSGILQAAEAAAADLIVVATHGRHGVDRLLHGSVVSDMMHHATIPLLILHGGMERPAAEAETVSAAFQLRI